jgi:hypothetical protein
VPIERRLTEEDARRALGDHIAARAHGARERHGPRLDRLALVRLLGDPESTRRPTVLRFDAAELRPGEFGFAAPVAGSGGERWAITLHPIFEHDEEAVALLASYHLVSINYGEIASHEEAEEYGSILCGLDREEYYRRVCALADRF